MSRRSAVKHYHVLFGLSGGYLPSDNAVFRTLREARSYAADLAREIREYEGKKVVGSARLGYYDVGDYEYIEITDPCYEPECLV